MNMELSQQTAALQKKLVSLSKRKRRRLGRTAMNNFFCTESKNCHLSAEMLEMFQHNLKHI
ncbi:hypothetical protein L798_12377 [Zootermopsis nevadensis]|uniref:Uncharacterized protein n=1 Tax=Zootermopsis nevadensis TaxID=136037 RepID=A0A067RS24_ZOONE|nr:hypothetical protein L798_12377 [Zootermopsis nevadensis]